MKKILILIMLLILCVGCSKKEDKKESEENTQKISKEEKETVNERPYLVKKYLQIEKGTSFIEVQAIVETDGIKVDDPGEYDAPKGYKKREVSIVDGKQKLSITFRDDKVCSKTFTYDVDNTNSTWFYSNFYDVLDDDPQAGEEFGIWIEGKKQIECDDELEMAIQIYDNIENK